MITKAKGKALITGASLGIGAIYADRLARRGYDLILVARNKTRLDDLASRLRQQTNRAVETVAADLSQDLGLHRVEKLLRNDSAISLLVNNAGVGALGPLLATEIGIMDEMVALNVKALTHLSYAAAHSFVSQGGGTIINIGSVLGVTPEAFNGVYGATKAFVFALGLSLHNELSEKNVRIQTVLPGATATEFWETAGQAVETLPPQMVMQAGDLVDAALAGLDQGEIVTIPSLPDISDWDAYEAARQKLIPNLSLRVPADRYQSKSAA